MLKTVLLVDDSEDLHYLISRFLKKKKLAERFESAFDGQEAIEKIHELIPAGNVVEPELELILVDINMPGTNGFEFLESFAELKGENPQLDQVACMMVSTSSHQQDREQFFKYDFVLNFIQKPIVPDDFEALIRQTFPQKF